MKNLRKLTKSNLKKINGGNAPECPPDTTPCLILGQNGFPHRWTCTPVTQECP